MNAKQELLKHVKDREVKYVLIARASEPEDGLAIQGTLEEVLPLLDFEYDDGYGIKEIHGIIWYTDGTWSCRGEYDGSEWWEHHVCPECPV